MGYRDYDPRSSHEKGTWTTEPSSAGIARAPEFGQRFFAEVFTRFPDLLKPPNSVTFMTWSVQPDDVYAVFELAKGGFGVQIDPDLDYVIVWGFGGQREYGDWNGDRLERAVAHVGYLLAREPS